MARKKVPASVLTILLALAVSCSVENVDYSSGGRAEFIRYLTGVSSSQPLPQSPARNQLPNYASNISVEEGVPRATTLHGNPVLSLTASQAIGTRGHLLLQDLFLIEKLQSLAREKIPERVAHAKGTGAHGYFEVLNDVTKYTKAKFLNQIGKKTRIFVRFSTTSGEVGTSDTAVDPHGFAVKFYTEDGNFDIVGNTLEPFPIRDPMLFSDLTHSRGRNPQTNLKDQNMWWDFVSLRPETTLHTLHLFSDNGRPDGYRRADGFGVHTFKVVNAKGQVFFCRFKWTTRQPAHALTRQRAAELAGTNPEYKTQDLFDSIARGEAPSWDFNIQIMTVEQARKYPRNPFDITRVWREEDFPSIPVGRLTLNQNPINFFAEVEQSAFSVANLVPGVEPSPDRMLASRMFSYQDAQRYRLTTNNAQIPINRPVVPVNSYSRNGLACHSDNGGASPTYYPNSFGGFEPDIQDARQVAFSVEGVVDRYDIPEDEHVEARIFLERDVNPAERARLVDGIAARLKDAREEIRERALRNNFYPVQKALGDEIRAAVKQALAEDQKNASRASASG